MRSPARMYSWNQVLRIQISGLYVLRILNIIDDDENTDTV